MEIMPNKAFVFEISICFRVCDSCRSLELGNRGSRGNRESRTGEALESRACEIMRSDPRNSGVMDERFGNQKEAKSKTLPQKFGFGV
jgi:hypothetical protein